MTASPPDAVSRHPGAPAAFRSAVRQIHLWSGLVLGIYLAMLSITGSALVYRLELIRHFQIPAPAFDPDRVPLSSDALADAARRNHPGYEVIGAGTRISRYRPVVEVSLSKGDERIDRLFDPYTGTDLGESTSPVMRALAWLARLHDELLLGETGRTLNGIGSALVGLLVVTGLITWWPASAVSRRVGGSRTRATRALASRLHRRFGIWGAALLLVWVLSGIYFAFPEPFNAAAALVSGDDLAGVGYDALTWLTYLHFGRFSAAAQIVWLVVGLVPAVLVVTGISMWWTHRIRRSAPRQPVPAPANASGLSPRAATSIVLVTAAGGVWVLYAWANYREEHHVERFLDAVAAGQYRQAHAMWDGAAYTFERFLEDWGAEGRHRAGAPGMKVVDSSTYGAVVTVYVRTAAASPVALEVDKETLGLSYASYNKYAPDVESR